MSQAVSDQNPFQTVVDFLMSFPETFVLHQLPNPVGFYITAVKFEGVEIVFPLSEVNLATLAEAFDRIYKPVTKVMKDLAIKGALSALISTLNSLEISNAGTGYLIALAQHQLSQ